MMKIFLTLAFALAAMTFCHAQIVESRNLFGGYKYTQNGKKMNMKDLALTIKSDPKSFEMFKKAKSNKTVAFIVGIAGGFLAGWPLGTALSGGKPSHTLAGIGGGLIAVAIPLSSEGNKKVNRAVKLYNESLGITSRREIKPEFKIMLNAKGFGIAMNF